MWKNRFYANISKSVKNIICAISWRSERCSERCGIRDLFPGDDDIDVGMPREDYEKFLQIAQKECGEEYFLQTVDTDPEYHLYFAKLRMNHTRFVENSLPKGGKLLPDSILISFLMMRSRMMRQRWKNS